MKPLSVEDGMSDEQHYACVMEGVTHAPNGFYAMCHTAGCYWSTHTDCMTKEEAQRAADEHSAKLPKPAEDAIRSATPEELTAQRESYGKNYKPGPRQAVPFMPAAVPVEERTAEMGILNEIVNGGYLDRFPEQKRRVLDHIEGKAKLGSIQEVKE